MPELPEVESLKRSLEPYIVGKKVISVDVNKPKLVSGNGTKRIANQTKKLEFEKEISGQKIFSVQRIAKNLLFTFESGKVMLVHLKMTGQLVYQYENKNFALGGHPIEISEHQIPNKHTHIVFALDEGVLYYNDVRMFGYVLYFPNLEELNRSDHFLNLGMDPVTDNFDLNNFILALSNRTKLLKSVLLDQDVVVGLGNIYVDEACFYAGIKPDRPANSLSKHEVKKLYFAIKNILSKAIEMRGSSIANYIMADGSRGTYAREHKVYGKSGENCPICQTPLKSQKIQSRTTVSCPKCQK